MIRAVAHVALAVLWIAVIAGLLALGTWQVQRRAWKLDLIARVDARLKAPPVPAPALADTEDAYSRVSATGRFLPGKDSFVQASTVQGPGWWVMTPLRVEALGDKRAPRTILINRGYVAERRAAPVPTERVTITGLLRLTEPKGGFLRSNDPVAQRWHSRDVAAIAARQGLTDTAPYFIDADAAGNAPGQPVGGLTVVKFPNSHLVYAITWYVLAMMTAAGFYYWITLVRRRGRPA
ncbi:SURF1 family protein [Sphingomonas qilianensis]|uniref:SURF1-like protein n=1 Tax=Sphingomonas qilianensis TaxID=1736690 RepID=A0ABU9XSF1_9SPHN